MIRLTLLTLFVTYFCLTAFKDWYRSLCVLIVMIGIVEHPDMPKTIMGIQGLNPWNILMLFVLAGWFFARKKDESTLAISPGIKVLLVIYVSFVFISVFRLLANYDNFVTWASITMPEVDSKMSLISEHIINSIKWLVPAFLLYKGCNTRERLYWAIGAILLVYILLGIQVIRWMPFSTLTGGDALSERSLKILSNEVGFHRVNLSMLLAGGSWAVFCTRIWFQSRSLFLIVCFTSVVLLLAVALTGGRTGYVTWAFVGGMVASVKWKKYIILAPIPVLVLYLVVPSAFDRLFQGTDENETIEMSEQLRDDLMMTQTDMMLYSITSGRNIAWPFVLDKVSEKPLLGHGRRAMVTTGITAFLWTEYSESFPHPHNLYLEFLMENGIVGFLPVFLFYLIVLWRSYCLFKGTENIDQQVVGGVCFTLLLAFMFAGIGSQTFYPREGAVGMWGAMALVLRYWYLKEPAVKRSVFDDEVENDAKVENDGFAWETPRSS